MCVEGGKNPKTVSESPCLLQIYQKDECTVEFEIPQVAYLQLFFMQKLSFFAALYHVTFQCKN